MTNTFNHKYSNALGGFSFPNYRIGAPTSPQTPNQIEQLGLLLNQGMKNVEIGVLQPEVFDQVPKQHFDEMRRAAELSGVKLSVHAPLLDPAGFSQDSWSEHQQKTVELQLNSILERAAKLNIKESVPVNIHSTGGIPSFLFQKEGLFEDVEKKKPTQLKAMFIVDQETGKIAPLQHEIKYTPGGQPQVYTPEIKLELHNKTTWDDEKLRILSFKKERSELQEKFDVVAASLEPLEYGEESKSLTQDERDSLNRGRRNLSILYDHITEIDTHMHSGIHDMYTKIRKFSPEILEKNEDAKKIISQIREEEKKAAELSKQIEKTANPYQKIQLERERNDVIKTSEEVVLNLLSRLPPPQVWKPVDDFAKEKTAETFANSAFHAFKQFKEKAPTIVVENVFPEMALSRAKSLGETIDLSRKKFAERLMKEEKMSKEKAEDTANKLIGATWDVGHINLLRKSGYSSEDIKKEAEQIAKYVKHIHLTDNFGFSDSHLALGMGNVDINDVLKILEKGGAQGEAIVESGAFVQHFKQSPYLPSLESLNSSFYLYENEPYWKTVSTTIPQYSIGYGNLLPEQHFNMYGSGFSTLPRELGGQVGGEKSRFAGTPNQ